MFGASPEPSLLETRLDSHRPSTAGHGLDNQDLLARRNFRIKTIQTPDLVTVNVNIHETAQRPGFITQTPGQDRIISGHRVQQLSNGHSTVGGRSQIGLSADERLQDTRQQDRKVSHNGPNQVPER
ncbi:hypothetical protein GCM10010052_28500 [Paenarthrobacter histidinolovorans]|nr:hypothetical protein GCM10010052_28500 [Paenarthrobacter histidinolovorans]